MNGVARRFLLIAGALLGALLLLVPLTALAQQAGAARDFAAPTGGPALTLTTPVNPASRAPALITAVFTEPVHAFQLADVHVTNGTAANLFPISGVADTFTFEVSPTVSPIAAATPVTVAIPATVTTGFGSGLPNLAGQLVVTFVPGLPVTLTTGATPTNTAPIRVTAVFSEPVTAFQVADLVVANGVAANLQPPGGGVDTFTFDLSPLTAPVTAPLPVTVTLPAHVATGSGSGLTNQAAQLAVLFVPGLAVTLTTPANPANAFPVAVTAVFPEPVHAFQPADLDAVNGDVTNLRPDSGIADRFTFDVAPNPPPSAANVTVLVTLRADATTGYGSGLTNQESQLTITFDTLPPTVTLAALGVANGSTTSWTTVPMTATFSEDVQDFTAGDLVVTGAATVTHFVARSARAYTFRLGFLAEGVVTVAVPAGAATDGVNGSLAAAPYSVTYDDQLPAGYAAVFLPVARRPYRLLGGAITLDHDGMRTRGVTTFDGRAALDFSQLQFDQSLPPTEVKVWSGATEPPTWTQYSITHPLTLTNPAPGAHDLFVRFRHGQGQPTAVRPFTLFYIPNGDFGVSGILNIDYWDYESEPDAEVEILDDGFLVLGQDDLMDCGPAEIGRARIWLDLLALPPNSDYVLYVEGTVYTED
ncbi:MAG: hypothetical protein KC425_13330, partial [Anaerolineales bacterium]|nr:hypothetical protein [Anaerolineales bacterium]